MRLEYILKWREHPLNKPPRHSKGKTNSESVPRQRRRTNPESYTQQDPKGLVEWVPYSGTDGIHSKHPIVLAVTTDCYRKMREV